MKNDCNIPCISKISLVANVLVAPSWYRAGLPFAAPSEVGGGEWLVRVNKLGGEVLCTLSARSSKSHG